MADKRGLWNKRELRKVWENYIKSERFQKRFKKEDIEKLNLHLAELAPCYHCGRMMSRTQYVGEQPTGKNKWDVNHINGDYNNNQKYNLEPTHIECKSKYIEKNPVVTNTENSTKE